MPPTLANGKICYVEIPAADVPRSVAFYEAVFRWQIRRRGDGSTAFGDGIGQVSGAWVTGRPPSGQPGLLIYIMVDNIAAVIESILAHGRDFAEKSFTNGVTILIALLVVNRRQADAIRIADEARRAWDDKAFQQQLDEALKGEVPLPWP